MMLAVPRLINLCFLLALPFAAGLVAYLACFAFYDPLVYRGDHRRSARRPPRPTGQPSEVAIARAPVPPPPYAARVRGNMPRHAQWTREVGTRKITKRELERLQS
jgi:hypothetical protein